VTLPSFAYSAPTSVADAVGLLTDPAAALLAGGHTLLYAMKTGQLAPPLVVDLRRVTELRGVRPSGDGGLVVGAMTTLDQLAAVPELARWQPACAQALAVLGDPQVRNRGTVGGNLVAGARPGGPALRTDLPAVLLAAEGTLTLLGPDGTRTVAAADFFDPRVGPPVAGEVLVAAELPAAGAGWSGAYEKLRDRASLAPLAAVSVAVSLDGGGAVAGCRVGLTGAVARATRLRDVEEALVGVPPTADAVRAALPPVPASLFLDRRGSGAEYLARLAGVLVGRALVRATADLAAAPAR
jgi:aerobic carbon-monoxide dehydrogenase medium subunit